MTKKDKIIFPNWRETTLSSHRAGTSPQHFHKAEIIQVYAISTHQKNNNPGKSCGGESNKLLDVEISAWSHHWHFLREGDATADLLGKR